jgi:tRNA pseudouridine55 synthase
METHRTVRENDPSAGGEILLIRKPKGWTSFDVVKKVRRVLRVRKAGHAGTLDPIATGLLIVGTNAQTKTLGRMLELEKEYVVTMMLGARTESFDSETPCIDQVAEVHVSREGLQTVLEDFVGDQLQLPPMYSAVKVLGKPLYKYARQGKTVAREERRVFIRSLSIVSFEPPEVSMRIVCSKGTYVRTLVNDIGIRLGCGAFMTALERVRIGEYRLEQALSLNDLAPPAESEGGA